MESLEKFIEQRMQQSKFSAMMIPRYLANPSAFLGSKNYTLEQSEEFKKDAEKCKAVLTFLKDYNKKPSSVKMFHALTGVTGFFVKEFKGYYGLSIMIRLDDGREYYAPKREFTLL